MGKGNNYAISLIGWSGVMRQFAILVFSCIDDLGGGPPLLDE
jgi:hypothetical protein